MKNKLTFLLACLAAPAGLALQFPYKRPSKCLKKSMKTKTENTYFTVVGPHGGLGGEAFATNGTVERPIFQPLQLGLVVPQMLL